MASNTSSIQVQRRHLLCCCGACPNEHFGLTMAQTIKMAVRWGPLDFLSIENRVGDFLVRTYFCIRLRFCAPRAVHLHYAEPDWNWYKHLEGKVA